MKYAFILSHLSSLQKYFLETLEGTFFLLFSRNVVATVLYFHTKSTDSYYTTLTTATSNKSKESSEFNQR